MIRRLTWREKLSRRRNGERTQEILRGLHGAVVNYDEDRAVEWAKIALDEGVDPFVASMAGGMVDCNY